MLGLEHTGEKTIQFTLQTWTYYEQLYLGTIGADKAYIYSEAEPSSPSSSLSSWQF